MFVSHCCCWLSCAGADDMAFDWLSRNWFFTSGSQARVFVCGHSSGACKTLLNTDLHSPRAIALDPLQG